MSETDDLIELHTFFDAIAAGDACAYLEQAEIPFTMKDWGVPSQGVDRFTDPPPIQLQILVEKDDLARSQSVLRARMHLFPEQEVRDPEWLSPKGNEDDIRTQAAACEGLEDATALADALRHANISCVVRTLRDEEDPDWISYSVDVKHEDINRAFEAIEKWAGGAD